ncbi:UNKNOWN [Stylonychia lemnae]|uniref:Uncharacterized protein n=1 Tax=Stylonychia lemnae TaxID=5949 RepID=A0A077ZZV3_STYLE|nr:UNKNOWN [Stylonychia lemnae]|eukprot:CDW75461.1 UNKNOWN [Stylonychia lemnae]
MMPRRNMLSVEYCYDADNRNRFVDFIGFSNFIFLIQNLEKKKNNIKDEILALLYLHQHFNRISELRLKVKYFYIFACLRNKKSYKTFIFKHLQIRDHCFLVKTMISFKGYISEAQYLDLNRLDTVPLILITYRDIQLFFHLINDIKHIMKQVTEQNL